MFLAYSYTEPHNSMLPVGCQISNDVIHDLAYKPYEYRHQCVKYEHVVYH